MPPLSSLEKKPVTTSAEEELRNRKTDLYNELVRSTIDAFDTASDAGVSLITPSEGDFLDPILIETPKATFKVEGQKPNDFTRAWLRQYPRRYKGARSPVEIVTDTVRFRKGVPKIVDGSETTHLMVRSAAISTLPVGLLDHEAVSLLTDASETVALVQAAIGEQALKNL